MLRAARVLGVCADPPYRSRRLGRLLGAGTATDPPPPTHAHRHLNSDTTTSATRRSRPGGSPWGRSRTAPARLVSVALGWPRCSKPDRRGGPSLKYCCPPPEDL